VARVERARKIRSRTEAEDEMVGGQQLLVIPGLLQKGGDGSLGGELAD
jgi:hypothetical protein